MATLRRLLHRLLTLVHGGRAEADLAREINAHLQLLEDSYVAQGMSPGDASAAARRAFGGQVEQVKERQRDARSFRWMSESWLDLKLGTRMLVKYPGLTVIAVFALAVAIGGGAAYLEFVNDLRYPTLQVKDGDRIVGIQNWNVATGAPERRTLHDFLRWRESLTSIEHIGAAMPFERNLTTADGRVEPISGVAISASAFRIIPTAPLLGRPLIPEDEQLGAAPVAVIGYSLWQSRFGEDTGVIGRTIRLGDETYTIAGVMPEGFLFPINHSLWVPLRAHPATRRGEGPALRVFGRLAPGATVESAQAELAAVAGRLNAGAASPDQQLQPQVAPYVDSVWSAIDNGQLQILVLYSVNLFFVALLGVCGANVATLVFARTAMREGEITVRTALGASRGRIVGQLFAEALVLASLAAVVGLAAASYGTRWGKESFMTGAGDGIAPFWWNDALSPLTFAYAGVLTLLAAVLVGVVPAMKATGAQMQARLKYAAAGATIKFGGMWTVVIVSQIALTVVFLLSLATIGWNLQRSQFTSLTAAFAHDQYLSARLEMANESAAIGPEEANVADRARLRTAYLDIERRLSSEPRVDGVTYASALPGMNHGEFVLEFESMQVPVPDHGPLWVRSAYVAANYFDTLRVPIVAGRGFTAADADLERQVAIVDQAFVQHVLGGRNPIGTRVRQPRFSENPTPGPWYEIVGVVPDLLNTRGKTSEDAVLYRPIPPGAATTMHVAMRVQGDPRSYGDRLRSIAAAADPGLRVYDVLRLDQLDHAERAALSFFLRALAIVSAVTLLLATAGVYALLSFAVARRTREIGIRAAVGAGPRQILAGIFSRTLMQVSVGIMAGLVPGAVVIAGGAPELSGSGWPMALIICASVTGFMVAVTACACVVPARRALQIQPTDALRADA